MPTPNTPMDTGLISIHAGFMPSIVTFISSIVAWPVFFNMALNDECMPGSNTNRSFSRTISNASLLYVPKENVDCADTYGSLIASTVALKSPATMGALTSTVKMPSTSVIIVPELPPYP